MVINRPPCLGDFFRDPSFTSGRRSSNERLDEPVWRYVDHELMDERFASAMQAAGFQLTAPSTCPGTKAPRSGYERP
jgi:hypothetical protein